MIDLHLRLPGAVDVERLREVLEREGLSVDSAPHGESSDLSLSARPTSSPSRGEDDDRGRLIEELELLVRELRNLDVAKSQFLANVSHELRTPLTAIVTYGEVLRDGLLGDLNERQREAVQSVIGSSRQLLTMIEEILTYARTNANAIELRPACFEVDSLIDTVVDMSSSLVRKKGIRLERSIDPSLPRADADRDKVLHVLTNLIGNAIEFTPQDGWIRFEARRWDRDGRWILIAVEDNGIGIDPQYHEMIFREFAQVDSSRARTHHGTGLGLAISRNFIQLHGGQIGVESELGRGSRFFFTIPSEEVSGGDRT